MELRPAKECPFHAQGVSELVCLELSRSGAVRAAGRRDQKYADPVRDPMISQTFVLEPRLGGDAKRRLSAWDEVTFVAGYA